MFSDTPEVRRMFSANEKKLFGVLKLGPHPEHVVIAGLLEAIDTVRNSMGVPKTELGAENSKIQRIQ